MHIFNMSEKIKVVQKTTDWKETDDYLMMRRLYQYYTWFRTRRFSGEIDLEEDL